MKDVDYYLDNLSFFQPLACVEDATLDEFRPDGWASPESRGESWGGPYGTRCCRLCGDELTQANQLTNGNRTCLSCLTKLRAKAEKGEVLVHITDCSRPV